MHSVLYVEPCLRYLIIPLIRVLFSCCQMVRHGGCLGLGLAAMGTNRQDVYEQLKFNLYQDDAVTGEAAGISMGMVMLGSKATQAIEDMVAVSQPLFCFVRCSPVTGFCEQIDEPLGSVKKVGYSLTSQGYN